MTRLFFSALLLFLIKGNGEAQTGQILQLRNCQKERRVTTYESQVKIFWQLVGGWTTLRTQKWVKFSPSYVVDTALLEKQIEKVRKSLPGNYFKSKKLMGEWYDNSPEESAIWFTIIFTNGGDPAELKVFSAIKIIFTGDDARLDGNRSDPLIKEVEFIFEPGKLKVIKDKLKHPWGT